MVRLKDKKNNYNAPICKEFQFLMVRLKVEAAGLNPNLA